MKLIPIDSLGECRFPSPLIERGLRFYNDEGIARHVRDIHLSAGESPGEMECFELAGAREKLYFNPRETTVGIVTCGGICPGLNDVIRAITFCAIEEYHVKRVLGFNYGYEGLVAKYYHQPLELTTDSTDEIHEKGGTILKTSRGPQPTLEIVQTLVHYGVDILFTIGGDGTQRGAAEIAAEIARRGLKTAIIGIPKTIDNDIQNVERTFGFQTAVETASQIITSAHAEAKSVHNGVGLVKVMGRNSGWIAAAAALANSNVNFCLIPEVPVDFDGPNGFFHHLEKRLNQKDHAVIVVAEGTGQDLFAGGEQHDKSGNKKLGDIGAWMRDEMTRHFSEKGDEINVKYFDPSYFIRSTPANATDSQYCLGLGYNAVHAGMAGKTNLVISSHCDRLIHVPITMISGGRLVEPNGWLWQMVLQTLNQSANMRNPGQVANSSEN